MPTAISPREIAVGLFFEIYAIFNKLVTINRLTLRALYSKIVLKYYVSY